MCEGVSRTDVEMKRLAFFEKNGKRHTTTTVLCKFADDVDLTSPETNKLILDKHYADADKKKKQKHKGGAQYKNNIAKYGWGLFTRDGDTAPFRALGFFVLKTQSEIKKDELDSGINTLISAPLPCDRTEFDETNAAHQAVILKYYNTRMRRAAGGDEVAEKRRKKQEQRRARLFRWLDGVISGERSKAVAELSNAIREEFFVAEASRFSPRRRIRRRAV